MSIALNILVLFVACVAQNNAARILAVYPTPSLSHQVVFQPLTIELVKRGHEVTVLTTDPIYKKGEAPANLTEIDFHDMSYDIWKKKFLNTKVTTGTSDDWYSQMETFFNLVTDVTAEQVKTKLVQDLLHDKSKQFDLLILEAWFDAPLVFSHLYKVPVILFSSFGPIPSNVKAVGAPMHPLVHPIFTNQKIYNLSLKEKIIQLLKVNQISNMFTALEHRTTRMFREILGNDLPTINELRENVDLLFINYSPIWDINRPVPPNVIYVGGVHVNPSNELPKNLKSYLDSSKNGVIYISFGTNVEPSLLPSYKIQSMINVFSKLPYDILWKWNKDELPGRSKNIRIEKWLPQTDLLKHPKVKAFITQGGLQSTDEAINAAVPLVGVPLLGDQWYNVQQYVNLKIGVHIDMGTITEEKLAYALNEVVNNTMYKKNIEKLRSAYHDQPQSSLDRAVWWTEYVLRHGGAKHLRSPSANISWAEYLILDVVLFVLASFLVLLATVIYIKKQFFKFIRKNDSSKLKSG